MIDHLTGIRSACQCLTGSLVLALLQPEPRVIGAEPLRVPCCAGDRLHFGIAAERAKAEGLKVCAALASLNLHDLGPRLHMARAANLGC